MGGKRLIGLVVILTAAIAFLVIGSIQQPARDGVERLPLPARDRRAKVVKETIERLKLSQADDYRTIRLGDVERPGQLVGSRSRLVRRVRVPFAAHYEVHVGGIDTALTITVATQTAPPTVTRAPANVWTRIKVPLDPRRGKSQSIRLSLEGDAGALAAWSQESVVPTSDEKGRPDVYIISLDTVRRDQLTPYAPSLPTTPVLARFASESLRFDQAISTSSWTIASHATLFTGAHPPDSLGYSTRVEPEELTLAERFAAAGYRTFGVSGGPYTDPRWGLHQGFDEYVVSGERENAARAVRRAQRWLDDVGQAPVFMFLNLFNAHEPLELSPAVQQAYGVTGGVSTAEWYLFDSGRAALTPDAREQIVRAYRAEVSEIDRQLEGFFETLKRLGRWDRSAVIVWADHGQLLGERDTVGHAFTLDEELIHVPLLVKPPRGVPLGPGVYPELFQNDDLFLLCQTLGGLHTPDAAGLLADLQAGRPVRSHAFAKIHHDPLPELIVARRWRSATLWAVRDTRSKLVRDLEGRTYLYDLTGPESERLVSTAHAPALVNALDWFIRSSSRPASRRTVGILSPEEIERLRSLGYIH